MAKRKRRARASKRTTRTSFRSCLTTLTMLAAMGTFAYYTVYEYIGVPAGTKAKIFAVYADLGLRPDTLARMAASPPPPSQKPAGAQWRIVTRVLDGDTVEVDGQKVRLIGVDTPESSENNELFRDVGRMRGLCTPEELVAMGKEAKRAARDMAEGRRCWLEFDSGRVDMYDRALAYVHLEDGTNLNEAMLAGGYAKVYLSSPFKYKKRYIYLQMDAMTGRRGFWRGEDKDNGEADGVAGAKAYAAKLFGP